MGSSVWFTLAACSYAASCALGGAVKSRRFDSSRIHWMHHALYICTLVLTIAAVSTVFWSTSRTGWYLAPALLPLAAIPYVSSHSNRHVYLALTAAPFFLLSLILSWR